MHSHSVLIIQTAFIGDVILATALVESWRNKFPDAPIDFVVRKGNEELLIGNPHIREVIVFDKSKKIKNLTALIRKIRKSRYDYVVNVQRFATTGLMTVFSGATTTIGFDKNPLSFLFTRRVPHETNGPHETERNQRLIDFLGCKMSKPRLYASISQVEKVQPFKKDTYITVSPASVWFTKQWAIEKWIDFLQSIPGDLSVFLLGGSKDANLCDEIISNCSSKKINNLAGKLSLLESAALMRDAKMNYVNDSAPLHLASAMNAPVTAIYCSTVPTFGFGPLSDKSFVIETEEKLDCRPCGLHGFKTCPNGHFKCATTIGVEKLLLTLR